MTREEIIATSTRIAEIRRELQNLNQLQKELRTLESRIDGISDSPAAPSIRTRISGEGSLFERAIGVVESITTKDWTSDEVAKSLNANPASVVSALSKAQKVGRILKSGRGRFRSIDVPTASGITEVENVAA